VSTRATARRLVVPVGVALLILLAAFIFIWLPMLIVSPEEGLTPDQRFAREHNVRTAGLQLLAGLLALAAVVTGFRSYQATRESHITERYTRAVEQLGSEEVDVRIGGIYALERLMRDSPHDQPTIVEVLSAVVRNRSASRSEASGNTAHGCPPDARAALVVIARRDTTAPDVAPDLSGAQLDGVVLRDAQLRNARLVGASLRGAQLWDADLSHANLIKSDLRDTLITGGRIDEADASKANAQRLSAAGLSGRGFVALEADLLSAKLINCVLENAEFHRANLRHANLRKSRFAGAFFEGADLHDASFFEADLRGVVTKGTDFSEARLSGALGRPT
jgi:uncharacterized protein YjbI with pentapeptide repeats